MVALVVIALATVCGMVALWPHGKTPAAASTEEAELLKHTYSGEIVSVTTLAGCCQKIEFELTDGPDKGKRKQGETAFGLGLPKWSVGDAVRVAKIGGADGEYRVVDFDRRVPLLWLVLAFSVLVIIFGRLRGALSLLGLAASLLIILVFVVPAVIRGSPPLAVALVGSMAVMLTTIPLAHGVGPKSLAAMAGIAISLVVIVVLAIVFTHMAHLTGVFSEEEIFLAGTHGGINFQSLLIAGMVIGSLGVLGDVAISQASTVLVLRKANPRLGFGEMFLHGIDVGRDHVSATVNTLVLAYAGASMTTLLFLSSGQFGFLDAVNLGGLASVIVASLVGSIGLICSVPITTAFAALLAENIPGELLAADQHLEHAHAH